MPHAFVILQLHSRTGYVLSMVSALRRHLRVRVVVVPGRGNHDSQLGCAAALLTESLCWLTHSHAHYLQRPDPTKRHVQCARHWRSSGGD